MPSRVYECGQEEVEAARRMLDYNPATDKSITLDEYNELLKDKYKGVIFSKQECYVREGREAGIQDGKYYIFINASEEFLGRAEERFAHEYKTIRRASPEAEQKITDLINAEQSRVNSGVGAIFGGF